MKLYLRAWLIAASLLVPLSVTAGERKPRTDAGWRTLNAVETTEIERDTRLNRGVWFEADVDGDGQSDIVYLAIRTNGKGSVRLVANLSSQPAHRVVLGTFPPDGGYSVTWLMISPVTSMRLRCTIDGCIPSAKGKTICPQTGVELARIGGGASIYCYEKKGQRFRRFSVGG